MVSDSITHFREASLSENRRTIAHSVAAPTGGWRTLWCGNHTILAKQGLLYDCWWPGSFCCHITSSNGIDYVGQMGPCHPQGGILTTSTISMLRSDKKSRYTFIYVFLSKFSMTRANSHALNFPSLALTLTSPCWPEQSISCPMLGHPSTKLDCYNWPTAIMPHTKWEKNVDRGTCWNTDLVLYEAWCHLTHWPQGYVINDVIFKLILWINILIISCKIVLRGMPQNTYDDGSTKDPMLT